MSLEITKIVLNVSFSEKDLVKSLGASWDPIGKYWYITTDHNQKPFKAWLPLNLKKTLKANKELANYKISNIGLLRAITSCWSCKGYTTVYAVYSEVIVDNEDNLKEGAFIFKNIIKLPDVLANFVRVKCNSFKLGKPNKEAFRYYRNHCEHCFQGLSDSMFFKKKGVFKPKAIKDAKLIQYIELPIFDTQEIIAEMIDYTDFSLFNQNVNKIDYVIDLV